VSGSADDDLVLVLRPLAAAIHALDKNWLLNRFAWTRLTGTFAESVAIIQSRHLRGIIIRDDCWASIANKHLILVQHIFNLLNDRRLASRLGAICDDCRELEGRVNQASLSRLLIER